MLSNQPQSSLLNNSNEELSDEPTSPQILPSKRPSSSSVDEKNQEPPEQKVKFQDDKPKSKFLQDRRSKLLSVLNRVSKQNAPSTSGANTSSPELIETSTPSEM